MGGLRLPLPVPSSSPPPSPYQVSLWVVCACPCPCPVAAATPASSTGSIWMRTCASRGGARGRCLCTSERRRRRQASDEGVTFAKRREAARQYVNILGGSEGCAGRMDWGLQGVARSWRLVMGSGQRPGTDTAPDGTARDLGRPGPEALLLLALHTGTSFGPPYRCAKPPTAPVLNVRWQISVHEGMRLMITGLTRVKSAKKSR